MLLLYNCNFMLLEININLEFFYHIKIIITVLVEQKVTYLLESN